MPNLFRTAAALLALGAVAALTAGGQQPDRKLPDQKPPDAKPVTDPDFVLKAASGGMFEVESSKLAKDAGQSAEVKKFADRMIADHGKANKELMDAAAKAGLTVPAKMLDHHQQMLDKLRAAKGADFDRAYITAQVAAHEEAVALFAGAARGVKDPGLRAFAEKTLPVLKEHYDHVKQHAKGGKDR